MSAPEGAKDTYIADAETARVVFEAREPHDAFLRYAEEHQVYVKPSDMRAIAERADAAEREAVAEYTGAVATAAARARDPRYMERKELSQVPGFNAAPTRVEVSGPDGTVGLANYLGNSRLTGPLNADSAAHLRLSHRSEGPEDVVGAIVVSDRHNGVAIEYSYAHNDRTVGMEIVVDERQADQLLPAIMGNPGILHQHAARIARGGAGRQHDARTFAAFQAAEPTTNDLGPDTAVVFQSQREGDGAYENHLLPLVPITPEAAAAPPALAR
jgi:hypothetical protein